MTYYPDLSSETLVDVGPHVRAIGWIDHVHPFATGECTELSKIREFAKRCDESTRALGWGIFAGFHRCDLCRSCTGTLNFAVPAGELLYIAPELIVHYIDEHDYLPPDEFIAATLEAPLPGTKKYEKLVAPFREAYRQRMEQHLKDM